MELLIDAETVEATTSASAPAASAAAAAPARRCREAAGHRVDLKTRLEACLIGRTLLACAQWAVVVALVTAGYFAAAGINAGIDYACGSAAAANHASVLATASQK